MSSCGAFAHAEHASRTLTQMRAASLPTLAVTQQRAGAAHLARLATQSAHHDPQILRVDGARSILVEEVERVLDLVELVLAQLLLSSIKPTLRRRARLRRRLRSGRGSVSASERREQRAKL